MAKGKSAVPTLIKNNWLLVSMSITVQITFILLFFQLGALWVLKVKPLSLTDNSYCLHISVILKIFFVTPLLLQWFALIFKRIILAVGRLRMKKMRMLAVRPRIKCYVFFVLYFVDCEDKNSRCSEWAQKGYCRGRYGRWMSTNCPKSCKKC